MTTIRTTSIDVIAATTRPSKIRTSSVNVVAAYKASTPDLSHIYVNYIYEPSAGNVYTESASSALTLTDTASAYLVHTATSTLSITQTAVTDLIHTASSILVIASTASHTIIQVQEALSELTITQAATFFNNLRPGSLIQLNQSVALNIVTNRETSSNLTINSQVTVNKVSQLQATSLLSISSLATAKHVVFVTADTSTLSITQSANCFRNASHSLVITSTAEGYIYFLTGVASSSLSLTQTVDLQKYIAVNAESVLNISQTAVKSSIWNRALSSMLELTQAAGNAKLHGDKFMILQAPFGLVRDTLILPAPLVDNSYARPLELIVKKSITDVCRTIVKSNLSVILKYTFSLTRSTADYLQHIVTYYNADFMLLQDWTGKKWKVRLITNPVVFTENSPFRVDVNLEFEGVQVNV